ncbi:MAG: SH3 domain-containing protein [Pseudomonadota bacterium]
MLRRFLFLMFFSLAPAMLAAGVLSAGSKPAQACACCGSYQVFGVASHDVLYVRTGPGPRFPVVTALRNGTQCIIVKGRRGSWLKISYAEYTGWAHSRYLRYFDGS